jgi:hypothetical protein
MSSAMSSRERWRAALHLQPADRLPFWPKLGAAYAPAQTAPFAAMTNAGLHAWIGSEAIAAQVRRDLDALPHHRGIVVTSAGVMPPLCRPETIRDVCRAVRACVPRW